MTITGKVKDFTVPYYFFIQLGIVVFVDYYRPFQPLTSIHNAAFVALLYAGITHGFAFSAGILFQKFRIKTTGTHLVPGNFEQLLTEPECRIGEVEISSSGFGNFTEKVEDQQHSLRDNAFTDAERGKFKINFEQAHPDFFENRKSKYPYLSNNEIWLLAYIYLKLSNKEIAALLNINAASVRRAKTRLNKRTGL